MGTYLRKKNYKTCLKLWFILTHLANEERLDKNWTGRFHKAVKKLETK